MSALAGEEQEQKRTYELTKGHELRIEVGWGKTVFLTLRQGMAEIFGSDLLLGQRYALSGQKVAVYTWQGAELIVAGDPDVIYESDETPMSSYLNCHAVLEERRKAARASGGEGPRCAVVGPADSGKSTLARVLGSYAARMGWAPTMVDVDVGQGGIGCPGSLAATPLDTPVDVEEGLPIDVPLVYFYGHTSPSENSELYRMLVERLAGVLGRRAGSSPDARAAGLVVNTCGWVEGQGYELLLHTLRALQVDVVLVVGQERLYSQLAAELRAGGGASAQAVQVVKLAKSGGVVARPPALRKEARTQRVRDYFYGARGDLQPHSATVRLTDLSVYRVGGAHRAPTSALPIGAVPASDPLRVTPVPVSMDLAHSLLAVSHAKEPEELLSANVAGYVYVTDVDVARGTVTYLAPCAGPLPGRFLLAGSVKVLLE